MSKKGITQCTKEAECLYHGVAHWYACGMACVQNELSHTQYWCCCMLQHRSDLLCDIQEQHWYCLRRWNISCRTVFVCCVPYVYLPFMALPPVSLHCLEVTKMTFAPFSLQDILNTPMEGQATSVHAVLQQLFATCYIWRTNSWNGTCTHKVQVKTEHVCGFFWHCSLKL